MKPLLVSMMTKVSCNMLKNILNLGEDMRCIGVKPETSASNAPSLPFYLQNKPDERRDVFNSLVEHSYYPAIAPTNNKSLLPPS